MTRPPVNPRYRGYRSFDYLAERPVREMAPQLDRVPEYDLGLSAAEWARVDRLMGEHLVVDLHEHVAAWPADLGELLDYGRAGRVELAYEGLAHSGLHAVIENMAGPTGRITSHAGWKWTDVVHDVGMRLADLAHQDFVVLARTMADVRAARDSGRLALVLAVEGAGFVENELDRLDVVFGLGVRQLGLVYNGTNMIGGGEQEFHDPGLTLFGRRVVRRCNALGLSIDVSHAGDRTCLDVIRASDHPVMISHAGARALWPTLRMKPDVVLTELAAAGGLLGVEAVPWTTPSPDHPAHSIESVVDHFEYCAELMGIDHVTFGPDTAYLDHVGCHEVLGALFDPPADGLAVTDPLTRVGVADPKPEPVTHCAGMDTPTEAYRNAAGLLVRRGWSDAEIAKVLGGNAARVLDQTWGG